MQENNNLTLNDICYLFQKNIISIFNDQQRIPFLLKYYLVKDIWNGIEQNKLNIDMEVHQKLEAKTKIITIGEQQNQNEQNNEQTQ